jgi:hypothetical protein
MMQTRTPAAASAAASPVVPLLLPWEREPATTDSTFQLARAGRAVRREEP